MSKNLHEEIAYSSDIYLLNSPAFHDCCLHLVCNGGKADFKYNGNPFRLSPAQFRTSGGKTPKKL